MYNLIFEDDSLVWQCDTCKNTFTDAFDAYTFHDCEAWKND
jgi:ribosomal protein L37AE/L43A